MKMHDKEKSERGLQILMMHDNETQTNGVPFNGRKYDEAVQTWTVLEVKIGPKADCLGPNRAVINIGMADRRSWLG